MAIWEWFFVAAGVLVLVTAVLLAAGFVSRRNKTQRLKQHYGREYERLVAEAGDQTAAEAELTARERNREKLDVIPLTPSALSDFTTRWNQVQTGFVDNPSTAVGVADRLVTG